MKILNIIKQEKNLLIASVFIGVFITVLFTTITKGYSYNMQKGIAGELIRFHVLANSDEDYDQDLKIKVKNEIIKMLSKELDESKSLDETRIFLLENLYKIEKRAKEVILENGYNYDVTAKISFENFPTKIYGDVTLPAGEYEALKIEIGEAKGKNWWCVMFPPLCFVDVAVKEVPEKDKQLFRNILTDEEYNLVTKLENEKDIPIKIKFKIVEFWQK